MLRLGWVWLVWGVLGCSMSLPAEAHRTREVSSDECWWEEEYWKRNISLTLPGKLTPVIEVFPGFEASNSDVSVAASFSLNGANATLIGTFRAADVTLKPLPLAPGSAGLVLYPIGSLLFEGVWWWNGSVKPRSSRGSKLEVELPSTMGYRTLSPHLAVTSCKDLSLTRHFNDPGLFEKSSRRIGLTEPGEVLIHTSVGGPAVGVLSGHFGSRVGLLETRGAMSRIEMPTYEGILRGWISSSRVRPFVEVTYVKVHPASPGALRTFFNLYPPATPQSSPSLVCDSTTLLSVSSHGVIAVIGEIAAGVVIERGEGASPGFSRVTLPTVHWLSTLEEAHWVIADEALERCKEMP